MGATDAVRCARRPPALPGPAGAGLRPAGVENVPVKIPTHGTDSLAPRGGFNVQDPTRHHIPSRPAPSLPTRGHIEHALDVYFLRTAETGRAAAPHQQVGPHVIQEWHRYHSWISRSKESLQHVITNSVMMEDDIVAADVIFVALFAIVLVALLVAIILVAIVLFAKILS